MASRPKFSADYFRAQQQKNQEEALRGLDSSSKVRVDHLGERDEIVLSPVQKARREGPNFTPKSVSNDKKRVMDTVDFPPDEEDLEGERPIKRIKFDHNNNKIEAESIESQPSLNESFDNGSFLKKFKGTPQKRLHGGSQSLSGSQRKDDALPAPLPVVTPAARPSLSAMLNESAKRMPPIHQSITKKAAKARETPYRAPRAQPAFVEDISVVPLLPRSSNLSPIPIRNPNLRFLDDDSPMKAGPQARSPTHLRQDSSSQEVQKEVIQDEEDDLEIEEVLDDIASQHDLQEEDNVIEPVDDFSEAEFIGKSFDSIEAGDVSRSGLGDVALPSIFGIDDDDGEQLRADEEVGEEEEEIKISPLNSPPSSPYREPSARPERKRRLEPSAADSNLAAEVETSEPSTLRDFWLSAYSKPNPFHLTPKDASQNPSSFVEKLSVESGKVTQGLGDLADYLPMASLMKGGLAYSALKIIEASKRRLPSAEVVESEGEGSWCVVEIVGVRLGFLIAHCVHSENASLFCDLMFKPRKSLDWESPHKAKGSIKGPISSQSLFALLAVGTSFKPITPFEYLAPPPPSTPPSNLSDSEQRNAPLSLRPALLMSNFETEILPSLPNFRIEDLKASTSFLSHSPLFPIDSAIPAPSLFANLSFQSFEAFASPINKEINLDRFKQKRHFSVSVPGLSPSDLLGRPDKFISFRGTVLKFVPPLETEETQDLPASFVDQALAKRLKSLSLNGDIFSQRRRGTLFVQLWAHSKSVVQIAVPLHNAALLEALDECEGHSFEFRGLRKLPSLDRSKSLPAPSETLDAKIASIQSDTDQFPDAMDIDGPPPQEHLTAPPSHPRIGLSFAFTSTSSISPLGSIVDSEALTSSTHFETLQTFLKEVYVAGLVGKEAPRGGVRVHLKGRLLILSLVPHSSLRFTDFAMLHLIDEGNRCVSFCVPHTLFASAKLGDLRALHAQLNTKNRSMALHFSNLLIDGDRILFDALSAIESYGDGTSTAFTSEFLKSMATDMLEIEKLAPSLRYFTLATLPELRVVHFRNKSVTNSTRKFHQPIVFKCDHGFLAAPVKVTNRLKRLFPSIGAFSFRSVNRGLLLTRARAEYRLVVVVEPLAISVSSSATPAFNLVLSHHFVASMLSRSEDSSAIAVDAYFLHSLPGTILPSQGRLAALVADAKNADELPTYELID